MPDALKQFLKSKTFKALVGVIASALAAYAATGCGVFSSPKSPALVKFECRAAVLAPFVGDAAGQVVTQIQGGQTSPVALLLSLGLTPDEIVAVAKAYQACGVPEAPAPSAPDAGIEAN